MLRLERADSATNSLRVALEANDFTVLEGGHVVYVPPQPMLDEQLGSDLALYPVPVGLKILKNPGDPSVARYLTERSASSARRTLIGAPRDQLIVANYLAVLGLGPAVRDIVRLDIGGRPHTAFVVEHAEGPPPTEQEAAHFVVDVGALIDEGRVDLALDDWLQHPDFAADGLAENIRVVNGRPLYVDFQNFYFPDRERWIADIVGDARDTLHFGDSRTLNSHMLYQAIPGRRDRSKRDTDERFALFRSRLEGAGLAFQDRVILDVGCNAGMMMHSALSAGAIWALGWDLPPLVEVTQQMLRALGTTRFDLFGRELHDGYDLSTDVPERLNGLLTESVVFYLAVHQHIGTNRSLAEMPWRAMVFEGHQLEGHAKTETAMAPFLRNASIVDEFVVEESDSRPRCCFLLVRD